MKLKYIRIRLSPAPDCGPNNPVGSTAPMNPYTDA